MRQDLDAPEAPIGTSDEDGPGLFLVVGDLDGGWVQDDECDQSAQGERRRETSSHGGSVTVCLKHEEHEVHPSQRTTKTSHQ